MLNLFEALMMICFGLSWPPSVYKSYRSRTAKGKSLTFELFVWLGYIFGVIRKILQIRIGDNLNWLFYLGMILYILNLCLITIDLFLYRRNRKLDMQREAEAA